MRRLKTNPRRLHVDLLPVVAAVATLASPASHAQFFSSTGDSSSFPVNFFPVNPASPVLNFSGNTVSIANSGVGSLVANNGGMLLADKLTIANNGTGVGGVTVMGVGTQVLLNGASPTSVNRLEVGNWGVGSLSVTGGAVVDASQNAAGCTAPGVFCNSFIGNAAGSSGVLNISGAGSMVSTIGFTGIGTTAVFTLANDSFNFGTPGGTTNGAVNVASGGRFNTQHANVGNGPTNLPATGTELGIGSVVVDGAGSQWLATRNTVSNTQANVIVGQSTGGQGTLIVLNGGQLMVDGTGGSNTNFDQLLIGNSGGQGTATVTGTGSNITIRGNNPLLQVGVNGGQGSLNALAGATVNSVFLQVGNGGTGNAVFDGTGTAVTLSGVGTPGFVTANSAGFMSVGRSGGSGQATVSGGAQVLINDAGLDSRASGSPGLQIARDTGSTGSLTITGAGSVMRISSTALGVATNDNFNPFVAVGRFDTGTSGTLTVNAGGKFILEGNAVSTATDPRTTYLGIGGSSDTVAGGTGTATVSGLGSEIRLFGSDTFITVGRGPGAVGTLTIANQGTVTATNGGMNVGRVGTGTLIVDNATLNLSGQYSSDTVSGAFLSIGNRGGTGFATFTNGSQVSMTNLGTSGASLNVGGTGPNPLGTGTLTMSGASQVNVTAASGLATFSVGRNGTGTANITQGSTVNIGDGTVYVGRLAGGQGNLTISGGSQVLGGNVNIGGTNDTDAGGTGHAIVTGAGSLLRASGATGFIGVGRLGGAGDLTVTDGAAVESTILHVGRGGGATGSLTVDNARIDVSGQQTIGNLSGARFAVGALGGTGVADIRNGSVVTVSNLGPDGAAVLVGGTATNPLGTGTLNVSNSQIVINAAPGLAHLSVGRDGTGTANLTQGSTVTLGDGLAAIGRFAGAQGTLNVSGGSTLQAGSIAIGGAGDGVPGGNGIATVGGLGSALQAASVNVGHGGSGTLTVNSQALITGTVLNVGLGAGSTGLLSVNAGTITLAGQTAGGQGASLNIGTGGGVGTASITNGSTVNIANAGSGGASLNVGGSPAAPLGTGTLSVANTTVNVSAAAGLGAVRIGHDGVGTASLIGSTVNVTGGSLIVAGLAGSVGTLVLNSSVVNTANALGTGYVGIGATQAVGGGPGTAGGSGVMVLNGSTINTNVFEIGAGGLLTGNDGVINATGDVIVAGVMNPGNSPGRIRINCNLISLVGSSLILEIQANGSGGFDVDQLIIGSTSTFDLNNFNIVFSFLGDTDVNAFAAAGLFDLDTFLRSGDIATPDAMGGDTVFGLSSVFSVLGADVGWNDVVDTGLITVMSTAFNVSGLSVDFETGAVSVSASRVPEPATWMMMLIGLLALSVVARRQQRGSFSTRH